MLRSTFALVLFEPVIGPDGFEVHHAEVFSMRFVSSGGRSGLWGPLFLVSISLKQTTLKHIRKEETHLGMQKFQAKPQTWLGNWLINARVVRADRWKDPPVRRGGRTGWCQHQGIMLATWLGGRLRCQVPAQRTSALSFSSSTSTVCPQDLLQHPFNFLHAQAHKCHNQQVQTETTWSGDWGALDISAASWVHRGGRQKQSDH